MRLRSVCVGLVVAAALAVTTPRVCAQDGLQGAFARVNLAWPANLGMPFSQTLATADFDGDNQPDGAVLVDCGWFRPQSSFRRIELHLTARGNTDLTFESNETALAVLALDVNSDGATDIVVEQPFTHKRLQVWLNDGHGSFRKVANHAFLSADATNHERIESPSQRPGCPAFCLLAQGGTETAKPPTQPLAGLAPSLTDFEALPGSTLLMMPVFSLHCSRAPPCIAL